MPGFVIEGAGRLVADDDFGIVDEGTGDGDALLLAAGKLAGQGGVALAEADVIEHFPCAWRWRRRAAFR